MRAKTGRPPWKVPYRDLESSGAHPKKHHTSHEDEGPDEVSLTGLKGTEITLTPKASSASTAEGTIFYDSDDNHVYVGTE